MSLLSNPKVLLAFRIIQLLFAIGFIALLSYCNQNPGYWTNLQGPVALGAVTFIFTIFVDLHGFWAHFKGASDHGRTFKAARLVFEFILVLMWIGTVSLMLRPAQNDYSKPPIPAPPFVEWDLGIAFSFVEIVSFIVTLVLEFFHLRSGGSSSSAQYV